MPNKRKQSKRKKAIAKKERPKRKPTRKKAASNQPTVASIKKFSVKRKRVTSMGLVTDACPPPSEQPQERKDNQSDNLQDLFSPPTANSESVDVEVLVEEGNALEAEAVLGVESASDADQGRVRTREVPEDDVPEEYLDKD